MSSSLTGRKTLVLSLAAFFLFLPGVVDTQEPEVHLEIRTSEARSITVYVARFSAPESEGARVFARRLQEVVTSDLDRSGFFKIVQIPVSDVEPFLQQRKQERGLVEEVIVEGKAFLEGGRIVFEGKLHEIESRKLIVNKRYRFSEHALRRGAHRFSDEIVLQLTGERGIASTSIAFVSAESGTKEVYVMDYDGHGRKQITAEKSLCLSPAWSPDGLKIAYTSYSRGNPDLRVVGRYGGQPQALSSYTGLNSSPAWSPDGSQVALTLTKDGNAEIYVMNTDGSGLRRLTRHPAIDSSPCWAPTGRQLAFTSDRRGNPQIFVMEADGSNVRRLTLQGAYNDSPAWSPKGDRIAYASRLGNYFQIFVMDIAGMTAVQLTDNRGNNENPGWSPDGRQIVFSSSVRGKRDIYVMNADGSNVRRLTNGGDNFNPSWSPRPGEE